MFVKQTALAVHDVSELKIYGKRKKIQLMVCPFQTPSIYMHSCDFLVELYGLFPEPICKGIFMLAYSSLLLIM